jgi:hypothetical protein
MSELVFLAGRPRPLIGFALGDPAPAPAPADPYQAASIRLSQLLAQVYAARRLIVGQQFASALSAIKGIGNDAAVNLGPQIDRGPRPDVTQPWTGDAWSINDRVLAPIAATGGEIEARAASDAIDKMMADYSTAINKAHAAIGIAPNTQPTAAWPYVLFAGTVLAAGGTAIYLMLAKR